MGTDNHRVEMVVENKIARQKRMSMWERCDMRTVLVLWWTPATFWNTPCVNGLRQGMNDDARIM